MSRTVPGFCSGLRAVALAAMFGGQTACVRSAPVVAASRATNVTGVSASVKTPVAEQGEGTTVVVRDYWRAFKASVVGWADDDEAQGLRAAVLRDGTVAYDHVVFYNAYAVPNLKAFFGATWYVFSDADKEGKQLQFAGMRTDQFNCQGKKGCSPYKYFAARVPGDVLRNSHDSLVVRVVAYGGIETTFTIRSDLIRPYLATVDSLSAARKVKAATSNQSRDF